MKDKKGPNEGFFIFFQFCEVGGVPIVRTQEDLTKFGYMSSVREESLFYLKKKVRIVCLSLATY